MTARPTGRRTEPPGARLTAPGLQAEGERPRVGGRPGGGESGALELQGTLGNRVGRRGPRLGEAVLAGADTAVVAAQVLPAGAAEQAARVLGAAREAYTKGLNAVGAVCAVIALGCAALAVTTLRKAS
ncbi:hypothetical protein ACFWF9_14115 [Streptomyces roseolus]|uniref:hypothetical protein n=1 Tax=Streptomyces roseolus TaxID=67358 RepID=UPI003661458F